MRLALLATLLLTGCTSTRTLDATNPDAVARAEADVVGRDVDIALVSGGRYHGRVQFLRPDSTAWADPSSYYVVPTTDVRSFVIDTRGRSLVRGALIGGGSAFALCFLTGASLSDSFDSRSSDNLRIGALFGAVCTPGGVLYGLLGGAVAGGHDEIILVGPAAARGAAAGPSE